MWASEKRFVISLSNPLCKRFDHRRRKDGWLAPSIQHKLDTHYKVIQKIVNIVPVKKVVIEVASFDIQKIKDADISGIGYQQGEYRGKKITAGQRRIKKSRYRYQPRDLVKFENKAYEVIGMQNLGTGVKLKDYPGVKNKVVNVNKVQPLRRRTGICTSLGER